MFVRGAVDVLVATDVAARGIHVDGVNAVIHFDPPSDEKDYVHRSGRTARAGATGVVVSLVTPDKVTAVKRLQRQLGTPGATTSPDMARITDVIGEPPTRRPSDPERTPGRGGGERPSHRGPQRSRRSSGPWKPRPASSANGSAARNGSSAGGGSSEGGSRAGGSGEGARRARSSGSSDPRAGVHKPGSGGKKKHPASSGAKKRANPSGSAKPGRPSASSKPGRPARPGSRGRPAGRGR